MIRDTLHTARVRLHNNITYIRFEIGYSHHKASFWMDCKLNDLKWWLHDRYMDIVVFRKRHRRIPDNWISLTRRKIVAGSPLVTRPRAMLIYSQTIRGSYHHSLRLTKHNTSKHAPVR